MNKVYCSMVIDQRPIVFGMSSATSNHNGGAAGVHRSANPLLRGQRVMLNPHLAELYDVEARVLVQAVKRNLDRFPSDFMFQLTWSEFDNLKSQIVTSSWGGMRRATPYAFTEQGVAMLSSVLRSDRAIQVNIEIRLAFVRLRQLLASHTDLGRKLDELERNTTRSSGWSSTRSAN